MASRSLVMMADVTLVCGLRAALSTRGFEGRQGGGEGDILCFLDRVSRDRGRASAIGNLDG